MASTSISTNDPLQQAIDRIAELESALQASQRLTQSATQELQHFVYAASHDLQEPLRAISTYTQLLERLHPTDQQAQELTAFITSGVARMNGLLQNLVTYSRINLTPPLRNISLNGPLQIALFKLAAAITQSNAVVRSSSMPEIPAHEGQMAQLFEQLILNAILFRRQQPVIEISAAEGELNGDPAHVLLIKDNGVGIEPQFLTQVLQPFKRLHGKDIPGNGLGLAICDKIVTAHHGKLWIESDGSTTTSVYIALPA